VDGDGVNDSTDNCPSITNGVSILTANGIAVQNSKIYTAGYAYSYSGTDAFIVYNTTSAGVPYILGQKESPTPSDCNGDLMHDVKVSGDYAYASDYDYGLAIYNISNSSYSLVGSSNLVDNCNFAASASLGFDIVGDFVYIADWEWGLNIVNVTDKTSPAFVSGGDLGMYSGACMATDVEVQNNKAYVASHGAACGFEIWNVSDANVTSPGDWIGNVVTDGSAWDVAVSGNFAFVAELSQSESGVGGDVGGVSIINITDPTSPVVVARIDNTTSVSFYGLYIDGDELYIANYSTGASIKKYNVTNKTNPTLMGTGPARSNNAMSIKVDSNYVYIAETDGIYILNKTTLTLVGELVNGSSQLDSDSDAYGDVCDCQPFNSSINPNATELSNGVDDDCDGSIDEVESNPSEQQLSESEDSSTSGGGGNPYRDIHSHSTLYENQIGIFEFSGHMAVREINPIAKEEISLPRVTVEYLNSNYDLEDIPEQISGLIYHYEKITANFNNSQIKDVIIKFRVEDGWIEDNNLKPEDVVLKRYSERWSDLNTEFIEEIEGYYYFESKSPGFSYFAIGNKSTVIEIEEDITDQLIAEPIIPEEDGQDIPKEKNVTKTNKGTWLIYIGIISLALVSLFCFIRYKKR